MLSKFTANAGGLLTFGADGLGSALCFSFSGWSSGLPTGAYLAGFSVDILRPTTTSCSGAPASSAWMVCFSYPTRNARGGLCLDTTYGSLCVGESSLTSRVRMSSCGGVVRTWPAWFLWAITCQGTFSTTVVVGGVSLNTKSLI